MKSMLKEGILAPFGNDSGVVNTHSGIVNGDSGNSQKVFTILRNGCSRFCGISVQDKPEWVFTIGRSMHHSESDHIALTTAQIADLTATSRNTVTKVLKQFESEGQVNLGYRSIAKGKTWDEEWCPYRGTLLSHNGIV